MRLLTLTRGDLAVAAVLAVALGAVSLLPPQPQPQPQPQPAATPTPQTGPTSVVQDCCKYDVESLATWNARVCFPSISKIMDHSFFRYYRANLFVECPLWQDEGGMCMSRDCAVSTCEADQLPDAVGDDGNAINQFRRGACGALNDLDTTLYPAERDTLARRAQHDDDGGADGQAAEFCPRDPTELEGSDFVNLDLNPERYTGYSGEPAHRIWETLYSENCFKWLGAESTGSLGGLGGGSSSEGGRDYLSLLADACQEKRSFYRIVSGLHASISLHICAGWQNQTTGEFRPNPSEYHRRFSPETTQGQGPEWLRNLDFTYAMVLRAVFKARPVWEAYPFWTGNAEADAATRADVAAFLAAGCGSDAASAFVESELFQADGAAGLQREFRDVFRSVARTMDCVGCDKCRLWGKLQVHGLGTALKILFTPDQHALALDRMDIVALFRVLERLSASINHVAALERAGSRQ